MENILISNDDGVNAQGLKVLAKKLGGSNVVKIFAPSRDCSGASSALTLDRPLTITELDNGFFSVDGTPADSAMMGVALSREVSEESMLDRVVSGINSHANLGDDVLYSGTVAAALEGRHLQKPSIAVSLVNRGDNNFGTAAQVVHDLLTGEGQLQCPPGTVLNINVPDVPYHKIKGIKVTRLGRRECGERPVKVVDPRGKARYWIGAAGKGTLQQEGTDFHAVERGYVSITPIHLDMTEYDVMGKLEDFLEGQQ